MTQPLEILEQMKAALDDAYAAGVRNTKREWVELTAEEIIDVANAELSPKSFARGVAWANAKLKEKNT